MSFEERVGDLLAGLVVDRDEGETLEGGDPVVVGGVPNDRFEAIGHALGGLDEE